MSEKQFLIVGALLVVLFVGLFGFLSYREYETYEALQAEVQALEAEITKYTDQINKINSLKADLDVLNQRFEKARKILPSDQELEGLITILNHLCKQTGMDYPRSLMKQKGSARPRAGAAGDIEEILYDIELEGTFFNFVRFVNWLEHYKRHMRMRTVNITGGGGEDSAIGLQDVPDYKLNLKFSLTMATYRYTGQTDGSAAEAELRVDDAILDESERIELEAFQKRDPFIFGLKPTKVDGPVKPGEEVDVTKDQDELLVKLNKALDDAKKLRHEVRKARQAGDIPVYWDIINRFNALTKWFTDQEARRDDTKKAAKELEVVIADIAKSMPVIVDRLIRERIDQVVAAADAAMEDARYGEAVTPLLTFLTEFADFDIPESNLPALSGVFDRVYQALTALVEQKSAYREAVDLIERIEAQMAPFTKRRGLEGKTFADFIERLREVKLKAQNIKDFRSLGIIVSGLIWVPDETGRICIVESGNVRQSAARPRRIFVEGEVIGTVKDETDTVRISKVTQFKSVDFEFRGLTIAQPLGDPKDQK